MSLHAKYLQCLPLIEARSSESHPSSLFAGVTDFWCVPYVPKNKRFKRNFLMKTTCEFQRCDEAGSGGLVRPALDVYANDAIEALRGEQIIALPTDTLYGFACDACSLEAVNKIYEIKGREHTKPLAICVSDVAEIDRVAVIDHLPHGLLNSLLPGPVTVVLKRGKSNMVEKSLNLGNPSIGVRVPNNEFIRIIARRSRMALALTSANASGERSSVCIEDFEKLWSHCAYIFDGGELAAFERAGSTVVDLTRQGSFEIVRSGSAKEGTMEILQRYSLVEWRK